MKSLPLIIALSLITIFPSFGYDQIEAESYDNMDGVQLENNNTTVGYIDNGDWLLYQNVNFNPGPGSIILSVATPNGAGQLEFYLDAPGGRLLGTFVPEATGSWTNFTEQQVNIDTVTGTHDLYILASGATGVCNMDYFILSDVRLTEPNWVLEWSDEFNGTAVDENYWRVVNHGNPDNGELQFYTPRTENVEVSNGTLKLIARKEEYTGQGPWMPEPATRSYTSGKLETESHIYFQYGKIEASMKLPRGKGTWPAFWALGENIFEPGIGWPRCGEIDIMEHGQDWDHLGAALHTGASNHNLGNQRTGTYHIDDYDTDFHTYGVEWSSDALKFYVDGNYYFTATKAELGSSFDEWPFDQGFYLILNHAVGGAWGGTPDDNLYPHTTEVDWVRVYKDQPLANYEPVPTISHKVYPNPCSDVLYLEEAKSSQTIEIIDPLGSAKSITLGEKSSLQVEHLSPGMYFGQFLDKSDQLKSFSFIKK